MSERTRLLEPNVGHFLFQFLADFWQTHGLWLMFFSAFLSATILPGNSEIVFVTLAAPKVLVGSLLSADIFGLFFWQLQAIHLAASPPTGLGDGFRKLTVKMTALYGR